MPDALAPVFMTLAGLAYGNPAAIGDYLLDHPFINGQWRIVWIPQSLPDPVNFAYIARNITDGSYVIAIRGTYPNPFSPAYWADSSQDNPLGTMQAWPLNVPSAPGEGPKISRGTAEAFSNLTSLSDDTHSLQTAITAIPATAQITVTGHSLGGTLAPVIALWLTTIRNGPAPIVYSFAGLTPGNQAFADLFDATQIAVFRYSNTLDSVPYGWNDIIATRDFYQPAPEGGLLVKAIIAALAVKLIAYGYAPIGPQIALPGVLRAPAIGLEFIAFVFENVYQHLPNTYLELLGAPPLPFDIVFGVLVLPPGQSTAQLHTTGRLPVAYA